MNDDLENDINVAAHEAIFSRDADEAKAHIRGVANRVAQRMHQMSQLQRDVDKKFKAFMAEYEEDLLSDPEILKRVQAREQVLMRRHPGMDDYQRWQRAANDVRRTYGDANQRVIRGMRQQRLGARLDSDTESYKFDTGSVDDDFINDAADADATADYSQAIMEMKIARMGRVNEVDKNRYNEAEVRRRQRERG